MPRLLAAPLAHLIQARTATLDHMLLVTCFLAGMGLDTIDKTIDRKLTSPAPSEPVYPVSMEARGEIVVYPLCGWASGAQWTFPKT